MSRTDRPSAEGYHPSDLEVVHAVKRSRTSGGRVVLYVTKDRPWGKDVLHCEVHDYWDAGPFANRTDARFCVSNPDAFCPGCEEIRKQKQQEKRDAERG